MLDLTPKELTKDRSIVINPAKTCQPIGALYAALGIHKCLPHSHGSQGCCSFHRMHLTRHFRDPIMASTSSFTEGSAVFGGKSNLQASIKNIFKIYNPDVIAIHTTCLSETIGDDISSIIQDTQIDDGKFLIHANTPSYVGSHITGFSNMTKGIVSYFSKVNEQGSNSKINIIPGFINPGDMREIKRILGLLNIPFIMFPDTSGVVDAPMTGKYDFYPKGGTKIPELIDTGNSIASIALGKFSSEDAAFALEKKCKVQPFTLNVPIGVKATDEFVMKLLKITGKSISQELEDERGQLVDIMTDIHYHYHDKKVAVFGDPDIVIPTVEFCLSLGMKPIHVLSGTPGEYFTKEIKSLLADKNINANIKASGDLFELHQWIKNEPVDLLIGNTYGKYISKAENIPLVRIGFPILDRAVHSYLPVVGYKGAIRIIEMISNSLLDKLDRECADEDLELVF